MHFVIYFVGQKDNTVLASHVLQFVFLSDSGFRFPIAQFASNNCTPSGLFFCFWEGVKRMVQTGFRLVTIVDLIKHKTNVGALGQMEHFSINCCKTS